MKRIWNIGMLIGMLTAGAAQGAVIVTSNDFSLGYGVTQNGTQSEQWNDIEITTPGVNTTVTGPFTLSVVFSSRSPSADLSDPSYDGAGSFTGPTFPDRVLSAGNTSAVSSWAPTFEVTVAGAYTGEVPANPQFSLVIDSIRIYGSFDGFSSTSEVATAGTMGFTEIGASSMTPIDVVGSTFVSISNTSLWTQLDWNPTDPTVSNVTSVSRTFWVATSLSNNRGFLDGFEVEGHLVAVVPEPAMLGVLALGLAVVLGRGRRTARSN